MYEMFLRLALILYIIALLFWPYKEEQHEAI